MLVFIAVLLIAIVALLLYASTRPDSCAFARSIHIAAPPERIFPWVDHPRAMNEWNPFVASDPKIKLSYSGPESGVGAANDFDGGARAGAGRAEIVESIPPSKVVIDLRMDRPMKCRNRVEFTITPRDGGSDVVWAMSGAQPFIGKVMSVFFNSEKMVNAAFDAGLAALKAKAEGRP